MKKINYKNLIIAILIPNVIGFIGGFLGNSFNGFTDIIKPSFTPNKIVFPIAWTILYILMGISSYIIYQSNDENKNKALKIYLLQLIINSSWSIFFFRFNWFLFSTFLILIILLLVIIMIKRFFIINKVSAYLQIPYILWLIFALILSYNVYLLN
jgi:tryptophan-rich sensory protein